MIYFAIFGVVAGLCIVWMMRDEIVSGYARHNDYWLVFPLLIIGGSLFYWAAYMLPDPVGLSAIVIIPVKAALTFVFFALFWGATIIAGALVLKILKTPHL